MCKLIRFLAVIDLETCLLVSFTDFIIIFTLIVFVNLLGIFIAVIIFAITLFTIYAISNVNNDSEIDNI